MIDSKRRSPPDVLALFHDVLARMDRSAGLSDAGPALWPRFAAYHERLSALPRHARRSLQRRWRCSLGGLALLLALGQAPALAADITVDTDIPDINVDDNCSLIEAIENANLDVAGPHLDCVPGSGPDTIILPANSTHTLTAVHNSNYGPTGLPVIRSPITIQGQDSTIRRQRADPDIFRILAVGNTGNLTLNRTTVSGGEAQSGAPSNLGGGVYNLGTLTLTESTVFENAARDGAGVFNAANAALTVTNSTISDNSAVADGGGVLIRSGGTVSLTGSTVSGNSAGDDGGGFDTSGTLKVVDSTVSGNSATGREPASDGGGVNNTGVFNIVNSTVSGNSAFSLGGGLRNFGTMAIANSTVASNAAGNLGGGLFNLGVLTFTHTLVSGNTAQTGPEAYNGSLGAVTTGNFNLFGRDGVPGLAGFPLGPTDLVSNVALNGILIPQLLRLGGPTRTLALVAGSPAVDAIPIASCTETTDQRGAPRPQDGDGDAVVKCDIGAFELGQMPPPPPPPTAPGPPPAPDSATDPLPLSDPSPSGCDVIDGVITCGVPGSDARFILLTTDIPADARFLQFEYTFSAGATNTVSAVGTRAPAGGLGAVFINGAPIAAFTADSVQQQGVFQTSGQFELSSSARGRVTTTIANYPLNGGSEFRVRNLRVDRCSEACFGKRATICGTNGPDSLQGTRRNDVIVGRGGRDNIKGLAGNDRICGGGDKDVLSGGKGQDRLDGGLGRDTCDGGAGRDTARRCDKNRGVP